MTSNEHTRTKPELLVVSDEAQDLPTGYDPAAGNWEELIKQARKNGVTLAPLHQCFGPQDPNPESFGEQ